jgi:mannose-1-phosphate guanylyltransferase
MYNKGRGKAKSKVGVTKSKKPTTSEVARGYLQQRNEQKVQRALEIRQFQERLNRTTQ